MLFMKRLLTFIVLITAFSANTYSQQTDSLGKTLANRQKQHVYKVNPWIDVPATLVFGGASVYGMSIIYGRKEIPGYQGTGDRF